MINIQFSEDTVREAVVAGRAGYLAEMRPPSAPEGWSTCSRSVDMYGCFSWLRGQLASLGVSDDVRLQAQWHFNRKSRSCDKLFALTAEILNMVVSGAVPVYRGR